MYKRSVHHFSRPAAEYAHLYINQYAATYYNLDNVLLTTKPTGLDAVRLVPFGGGHLQGREVTG